MSTARLRSEFREELDELRDAVVALARLHLAEGEADEIVFALCAPSAHPTMWRRWSEAKQVLDFRIEDLPAEEVAALHGEVRRRALDRYLSETGLPAPP